MNAHRPSRTTTTLTALSVVALALLTACGGGGSDSGSGPSGSAGYDPDGVLTWGIDLAGAGVPVYDPTKVKSFDTGSLYGELLYDTLLHQRPGGALGPGLATSATVVDPSTVRVTLRAGVTFQDGTPLDAAALKFTLERNARSQSIALPTPIHDVATVDTNGLEVTIHLSKPDAGAFYPLLAQVTTAPLSPAAVAKTDDDPITNPLGAGPFKVTAYQPEQRITFTKSPTYWDAKDIKLAGVRFVQTATGPSTVQALRAGTIDVAAIDQNQVSSLSGGGLETAKASSAQSLLWLPLCKTTPALKDERVRQALNYATDRNQINTALAGGEGQPAWSIVPPESPLFAKDLTNSYPHDPEKAKSLLAQAGYSNVTLTLMASPGISGTLAQIVQQQWKQAGINLQILPTANVVSDLYIDHKANIGASNVVRGGLDALSFIYTPGHLGDLCDYSDPTLTGYIDRLSSLATDDPRATALWAQAQHLVVEKALGVYIVWPPALLGYDSKRVANLQVIFPGVSPTPDFLTAYIKR